MVRIAFKLFRGEGVLFVITLICALIVALDGIVAPYFMGKFTNAMTSQAYDQVPFILLFWGGLIVLISVGQLLYSFFYGHIRQHINVSLKDQVFRHAYQSGNERVATSEYVATILNDIKQIETGFVNSVISFIYCILQGVITFVFLLNTNWRVGIVFVVLGFLPTVIPKLTSKWLKRGSETWQKNNQTYTNALEDGLQARKLVKRYSATSMIFQRLLGKLKNEESAYFTMNYRQKVSTFWVNALYAISTTVSLAIGSLVVIQGGMSLGALITVYMAADRVVTPLISGVTYYNLMAATQPLFKHVLNDTPRHVTRALPKLADTKDYLIQLKNVSVGYDDKPILTHLNLRIDEGDRVLIHGPSGAGKSTLMRVMMNEIGVLGGTITYGYGLAGDLTNHFAAVEQKPFLFNDTLKFNLTLGKPVAEEQLISVLVKVGLGHLANQDALDMPLGPDNHQLSGGEMKRLEVARSLLYGREILVVDEALSGLDADSADRLNQLIVSYPGTVIDIEHHINSEIAHRYNKEFVVGQ